MLLTHTYFTQINIFAVTLPPLAPSMIVPNPKSWKWSKWKTKKILLIKNLMLPHISASEIFLGCTIFILSILCVSAHSSVSNLGCTCVVRIRQCRSEVTDNKVWIKSIWCIREKFRLQNYGVASGFLLVNFFSFFISIIFKTLDLELS